MPTVAKIGNVTRPPELNFSKNDKPFAKFGIAVNPYVPKGQEQPPATFYDVVTFGSLAENVCQTVHKGHRVVVIGEGKEETWTGKDGKERTTKTILAEGVGPDLRFVVAEIHKPEEAAPAASGEEPF